jgi:pre-mRNA-splicing factor ATP-dependent RNA helicase DHX15/PRP43
MYYIKVTCHGSKQLQVEKGSYLTVKDNQVVLLHPSCGLKTQPKWVLFNEFVLTTWPFICAVTEVHPEWLLELAINYYDMVMFTNGKMKLALQCVMKKQVAGLDSKKHITVFLEMSLKKKIKPS